MVERRTHVLMAKYEAIIILGRLLHDELSELFLFQHSSMRGKVIGYPRNGLS